VRISFIRVFSRTAQGKAPLQTDWPEPAAK
jgi:hypothetical protein